MLNIEPIITYTVTHFYPKSRPAALATLRDVVSRLGYRIPTSVSGKPGEKVSKGADWDCHLTYTPREIRAVIRVYRLDASPIAIDGELPYLSIADYR